MYQSWGHSHNIADKVSCFVCLAVLLMTYSVMDKKLDNFRIYLTVEG